jgi:hypothetical protein
VAFELALLMAALAVFLGFFAFNRLPMPAHPLFRVPEFKLASQYSFFLCIRARRGGADPRLARLVLDPLHPVHVWEVEQ